MYSDTKNRIALAAQLKAESANWVGYNADLVSRAAEELHYAAERCDGERTENISTFIKWFAGILAIAIATLGLGTLFWWSDFHEKDAAKARVEIREQIMSEFLPLKSAEIFEQDGLLYIRK